MFWSKKDKKQNESKPERTDSRPAPAPESAKKESSGGAEGCAYFFMINSDRTVNKGKLQEGSPAANAIHKQLYASMAEKFPALMGSAALRKFVTIYPIEIEKAGAWSRDLAPQENQGSAAELSSRAKPFVRGYFGLSDAVFDRHCKGMEFLGSDSQIMCLMVSDCDLRLLSPKGSAPYLTAGQSPNNDIIIRGATDQMLFIFSGFSPDIRNFFDTDDKRSLEEKTGTKDVNAQMRVIDVATKAISASFGVVSMLTKENMKLGIPEAHIISVPESKTFFANVQWSILINTKKDKDTRKRLMQGALVSHAASYLKSKGYTDNEINTANIVFPDSLIQDKEPAVFHDGSLGDFYYFFEIAIWMNDFMRNEIAVEQKRKQDVEKQKIESGARLYFLSWLKGAGFDDALLNSPMFKTPSPMVLSKEFNFPIGNHYSLSIKDWNPPSFGQLSKAELTAGKTPAAQRYREQLKTSLSNHLKKIGYTQNEINNNYKLVGFSGRGGSSLMVVFEMNYKTFPKK